MMQAVRGLAARPLTRALAPSRRFGELVRPELTHALGEMGVHTPNAMQKDALPLALRGDDLMVCGATGSGKTLMFLLPLVQRLSDAEAREEASPPAALRPEALVLVPTPELGLQVKTVAEQLAAALPQPFGVACLTQPQAADSKGAPELEPSSMAARLLIATPSCLLPHLEDGRVCAGRLSMVAIDEADALYPAEGLEPSEEEINLHLAATTGEESSTMHHALASHSMSFGGQGHTAYDEAGFYVDEDASAVLAALPSEPRRQFILTMATVGAEHDARLRQHFPAARRVSHAGVLPPGLRQRFHLVSPSAAGGKTGQLVRLLRESEEDEWLAGGDAMVFCAEPGLAAEVHRLLEAELPERRPALLTERSSAPERSAAVAAVLEREARLLVCTDVASRGLDFPECRHVVMFDIPRDIAAFIHRAGRTARVGRVGHMSCLVQAHEVDLYKELHQGEAVPGTALHRSAGRAGVATADMRAPAAQQRGWLSKDDIAAAEGKARASPGVQIGQVDTKARRAPDTSVPGSNSKAWLP